MTVVALFAVLSRSGPDDRRGPDDEAHAPQGPLPTLAGPPPTDVRLRDSGAVITVTWTDPSAGTVSFVVTGGRPGEQLAAMGRLNPGSTRYELQGLNPRLDYCFAVVAVYAVDRFASSPQICTSRAGIRPSRNDPT
jgi:hypothetical protein